MGVMNGKHRMTNFPTRCYCARYVPLEVLNEDYSRLGKADMFALGASLYELATGSPLPTGGPPSWGIKASSPS